MQLICRSCRRSIEYDSERPRFCSHCGQSLSTATENPGDAPTVTRPAAVADATGEFLAVEETLPPRKALSQLRAEAPEKVGDYRIIRRLGGGGMGSVYEAEDANSGRRVAIKLIKPEYAFSQVTVERFRLEGRLASSITHPRCVFVLAAEEENRQPYIVMELMPGTTLADLVDERGPLPLTDAISRILDVIEGLQEAHRLGVIHRDVKPSNCFLDVDDRVKIGDFGLAKMAANDGDLTRTGTFIGTPLFSSPEQIKRQELTVHADIYSVCATLYYLLTGQAPFAGGDAMSAVARIVSDTPPSPRKLRPEIPQGLERVILRGLARDPENRWPDLESLQAALQAFLPGRLSRGGLGSRFGAYLLDVTLLDIAVFVVMHLILGHDSFLDPEETFANLDKTTRESLLIKSMLWFLYFGLLESFTGWTVGKWILRLRVSLEGGIEPPRLGRGLLRSIAFFALMQFGSIAAAILTHSYLPSGAAAKLPATDAAFVALVTFVPTVAFWLGFGLMVLPMRARNGYRGLHERVSGTRVIELPPKPRQRAFVCPKAELAVSTRADMPTQIGPYRVMGVADWRDGEQTYVAEDPTLGRKVWVWARPSSAEPLSPQRRDLNRPSRLRHIANGLEESIRWDAFLAPTGTPLPEIVRIQGRFPYADALFLLDQVAEELALSCKESTVPERLSPQQLFVDARGHVQLIGTPLGGGPEKPVDGDSQRSLEMLRQTAALLLEGRMRIESRPLQYQAPVPRFARPVLDPLLQPGYAMATVAEYRDGIRELMNRPQEVTRIRRFLHSGAATLFALSFFAVLMSTLQIFPLLAVKGALVFNEVGAESLDKSLKSEDSAHRLLAASIQPDPTQLIVGVAVHHFEQQNLMSFRAHLARQNQWLSARQRWTFLPVSGLLQAQEQNFRMWSRPDFGNAYVRRTLWRPDYTNYAAQMQPLPQVVWIVLAIIAIPTVIWSFLTRGGLLLPLLRLELVRKDGRPAARWQCVVRVILFWTPLFLLLGGALWLDAHFWTQSPPSIRTADRWQLWLSWILWWTGIVTTVLLLVASVWRPDRGPLDRLTGTRLVPR